jgi:hypothetical protein
MNKTIILLATSHERQRAGDGMNSEFEKRLAHLVNNFKVTLLMEEWTDKESPSFASQWVNGKPLGWKGIGTGDEPEFQTFRIPYTHHPAHDGTLGINLDAPSMCEYGPIGAQENRETKMAGNAEVEMKQHQSGLLIIGLAHLHSMSAKLENRGFKIFAYSWL